MTKMLFFVLFFTQNNVCFILNFEKNIFFFHSLFFNQSIWLDIFLVVCYFGWFFYSLKLTFRPTDQADSNCPNSKPSIIFSQKYTHVQYDIKNLRHQDTYNITSIKFVFAGITFFGILYTKYNNTLSLISFYHSWKM